ncbi:MAG: MopE-related protein, partial [Bacteroidota bacterium]
GGEFLSGNQVTIQWTGADVEGNTLAYDVQYSKDNGANWQTLAVDHPSQSLTVPLSELAETSLGLIRVYVSDGFHSSSDQSNATFTTPNNPPQMTLVLPFNNAAFVGVQPVFFEGFANDKEQGALPGASISWSSSLDGFLGAGTSFYITADQLAEGNHTITATATDGGGLTDQESVIINVTRIGGPGCGVEICNGLDDDCDNLIDDDDPSVTGASMWYADNDDDTYGDATNALAGCDQPAGYVGNQTDCDDDNANIHPNATELCNGQDDNCDNIVDALTYVGNVTLTTQTQVNNFADCYAVIQGNLVIKNAVINNLANLENLTQVTGNFTIQQTNCLNLNGLQNLANVGGTVLIKNNFLLNSLDGVEDLASVGGNLNVYYNSKLNDCCAIYDLINGGVSGSKAIYFNKTGCDNEAQINANCAGNALPQSPSDGPALKPIQLEPQHQAILLSPNPASQSVNLILDLEYDFGFAQVFDATGKLVETRELLASSDSHGFEVKAWQPGIYLFKVNLDGKIFSKKLMVE